MNEVIIIYYYYSVALGFFHPGRLTVTLNCLSNGGYLSNFCFRVNIHVYVSPSVILRIL